MPEFPHAHFRQRQGKPERLRVNHIDLYQLHNIDTVTPIEESLDTLVRQGLVRYVGVSNWASTLFRGDERGRGIPGSSASAASVLAAIAFAAASRSVFASTSTRSESSQTPMAAGVTTGEALTAIQE